MPVGRMANIGASRGARASALAALLTSGVLMVAACGTSGSSSSSLAAATSDATSSTATPNVSAAPTTTTAASPTITVGATAVGATVVDRTGRTTYTFDKDKPGWGTSSCTGVCATLWLPVTADGTPTAGPGIAAAVGVITGENGTQQVTLNGRPLYLFSGDHAAGDSKGDGIAGLWHVARPSGVSTASARAAISASNAAPAGPATSAAPATTTPPAPTTAPPTTPPTSPPTTAPTTVGGVSY